MAGDVIVLDDGRRIAISRVGSGPPLICLPGGPGFPGDQLGDLGGLSRDGTLLRVDWRGAGASDPPADGRHGIADYVADLAAVQSALGIEQLALFGHSFGGLVAATYAATFPNRVDHLILDGTPDRLDDGRAPEGGMPGYFVTWDERARGYLDEVMGRLYEPAAAWFSEHEHATCDLSPLVGSITCRTLIVTGDHDWAVGLERANAMAAAMPDAEVAVVRDAGHFAWVEQPDAYAHQVRSFLS